jgi:hypothetical protein
VEQLRLAAVREEESVAAPPIALDPERREAVAVLMAHALVKVHEAQGDRGTDDRASQ